MTPKKKKTGGLHEWFNQNNGKGWIDCKTGKPCGRKEGDGRKYPACRPTKAQCTAKGVKNKTGAKRTKWK